VARQALIPVIEFLRSHAPFDRMAPTHLEYLAKHLQLAFYSHDEVITQPTDDSAKRFYIIKQGRVRGETQNEQALSEDGAWELVAGECFPVGALLAKRPVRTVHRAVEDTFCFELDRELFDQLLQQSPEFHDFCTRRMASLLDQALLSVQAGLLTTNTSGGAALSATLASLVRREPVSCPPNAPIRDALASMHAERVGSIVVTDAKLKPLGVFTLRDLLERVVSSHTDLDMPIQKVMTPNPLSLPPHAAAHEAASLMVQKGFSHVCVVENDRLMGVVSERDLFSLQRVGMAQLSRSIAHAKDLDTLARLGRDIHGIIDQMLVQGASVEQLTQIITQLNDHITHRVITLCVAESDSLPVAFTWLSFGSEGREEQTLKTDQDNGILFMTPKGQSASKIRERLLPLARRINEALDTCGYPLCPGNIMASNPECCLSLEEWQERFQNWIEHGKPDHLLKANIFFDFRALFGDPAPASRLRRWVNQHASADSAFLRQMAENAMRKRPPLGLVRDFVVSHDDEHPDSIDLKLHGLMPFVDGARLLALAHGLSETGTMSRFRAAAKAGVLRAKEVDAWCDAYGFIQLLRMRLHQEQHRRGEPYSNFINPDTLNDLNRRILREAFRQSRKLQTHLAVEYQL